MSPPDGVKDTDKPPPPEPLEPLDERRSPRLRRPRHHGVVRPHASRRRRAITLAGLLLLVAAALGFYTAAGVFSQVGANRPSAIPQNPMNITGPVTDVTDNSPLPGVLVRIVGKNIENATNGEGWYFLDAVPPGTYTIEASKPGYTTLRKTVNVSPGIPVVEGFAMPPGNGTFDYAAEPAGHFTDPTVGVFGLGLAIMLNSVLATVGAWSAITHRHYLLAIAGAAAGTATGGLAFGAPIGSILAIAALAILGSLKTGFLEAQNHKIPWAERSPTTSRRGGPRNR
jgi:hypothetical protein